MSEFSCISAKRTLPLSEACTIPGVMSIRSPFFTDISSNIPEKSLFLAFSINISFVIPGFIPIIRTASSLASIINHDSLFPSSLCFLLATSSSGCTCMESLSFTSRYLISRGNLCPYSL